MKMIKPSFEILEPQGYDFISMCKNIELCGRICYKSEDKITDGSAEKFVKRMVDSSHNAMLEHGTVYLKITNMIAPEYSSNSNNYADWDLYKELHNKYSHNKYSHCIEKESSTLYITTNYRVIVENEWEDDLKYMCEPTDNHIKRITVKFICDRGVTHEFVRHRVMSIAQESTRYCNYSKEKFNNEITYICPCWLDYDKVQELVEIANKNNKEVYRMGHDENLSMEERGLCSFVHDMSNHEHGYLFQISAGWKAQEARSVLPTFVKSELVMTGFVDADGWLHFFDLRALGTTGAPHPQAKELALPLMEEFKKRGYIQ